MKGKKLSYKERIARLHEDANERKKLFKELQDHVAQGLSAECFEWLSLTSIKEMFEKYPEEFDQFEYEKALRKGRNTWEDIGFRQANGQCLGNSRTWYYNMSNRYGWKEKQEIEAKHEGSINVNIVSYKGSKPSSDS